MIRTSHSKRTSAGFSLLEVLIAVVLLATGLLALAALQGSLARNSADAKTRSRIVALLAADMDELRSTAYASLDTADLTFDADAAACVAPANAFQTAACRALTEAGLGALRVTRETTRFGANAAGTTFVENSAPLGSQTAEFIDIEVTATWTDATNQAHTQVMRGAVSSLALDPNSPLVDDDSASNVPPRAIVRQALSNIVSAGMIPIAMGNGDSTAASNPTPELVGKNNNQQLVGTKFQVVTYTPEGSLAVVQQRVENEVLKCTCQYGAGGTNLGEIYRKAQWPAVWTGKRYDLHVAENGATAPGEQYASGPAPNVTQSDLCQECCRDRHDDPADTINAKFDPENTSGVYQKYNLASPVEDPLVEVGTGAGTTYIESCRLIRVDGFWRTAADMYSRQFGLLETETVSNVEAKTGLPTTAAVSNYTTFVKDYLKTYDLSVGTGGTAPTGAQALYDDSTRALNTPDIVDVATPSNSDYRYLHARGLYVDFLEKLAREALTKSLADRRAKGECLAGSTGLADCVLPFLPFTTINLTEIADWSASDESILAVNSGNLLSLNPSQPSGSRAYAVKNGSANNIGTMRKSNSGVAVSTDIPRETDLQGDDATATDAQPFLVANNSGGTKDEFGVTLTGGGSNPYVFYVLSGDTGECVKPKNSNHRCTTNSTLPLGGDVRVEHYWQELTVTTDASVVLSGKQCMYSDGTMQTVETSGNDRNIDVPAFRNYAVTAASILGVPGIIAAAANEGLNTEATTITFSAIPKNGTVNITFTEQATVSATLVSCTATMDKQGNYHFGIPTWSKPWVPTP